MNNRENLRFAILAILLAEPAYTANQATLSVKLREQAVMASTAQIQLELSWLASVDAVIAKQPGGVWIATLTDSGAEHLQGLAPIPGIRPPRPGEIQAD